jgi:hypothetical protein
MHLFAITIGNHSPNRMDLVPNKSYYHKEKNMDPRTDRKIDGYVGDRQMDVQTNGHINRLNGQKGGWTNRWKNRPTHRLTCIWTYEQTERMNTQKNGRTDTDGHAKTYKCLQVQRVEGTKRWMNIQDNRQLGRGKDR